MVYFYLIALLNLLDLIFTTIALSFNITDEQNPIMRFLWEANPIYFISVKLALSILLIILARHLPSDTFRRWRLLIATTIILYVSVIGMHLIWVSTVL